MNIKKYVDGNGETRYKFRVYLGKTDTGKEVKIQKSGFRTMAQAKSAYLKLISSEEPLSDRNKLTYNELFEKWFRLYKTSVRESTWITVERYFKLHVLPRFGDKTISKISLDDAQDLILYLAENLEVYKTVFNYASKIFDYAIDLDLIRKNPCKLVVIPRKSGKTRVKTKARFWSAAELREFLAIIENELDPLWVAFFRLIALTGMRKGEILALEWKDIDFKNAQISVNKTMTKTKDNTKAVGETKTEAGTRLLDVDERTLELLKSWRVSQGRISKIVFSNPSGDYYIHSYPAKVLNRVIKKHDLTPVTIHSFRHTHCSLLIEAGAGIKEIQDRLGHAKVSTTMDVYAHVSKQKKQETVEKLIAHLG